MKVARNIAVCFVLLFAAADPASAQNILLKDGKTIVTKGLRRSGDIIMATVEITMPAAAGQAATVQTGEIGYPIDKIAKLDFPEPPDLRLVPEMIAAGKLPEALARIEPVVRQFESFRDAPGSWWQDALFLKVEVLQAMGNFKDSDPLIENLSRVATDPETVRSARVFVAAKLARRGDHAKAVEMFEQVLKDTTKPTTLATASVNLGQSYLGLKQYDAALLAFLQVPVFYPREKMLLAQSLLGSARAYYGLEDLAKAKTTLEELLKDFATSPQAAEARAEQEKIAKREKALAPPK